MRSSMRDRVPIIETRGRCRSGGKTLVLSRKAVASLYIPNLIGLLWNNRLPDVGRFHAAILSCSDSAEEEGRKKQKMKKKQRRKRQQVLFRLGEIAGNKEKKSNKMVFGPVVNNSPVVGLNQQKNNKERSKTREQVSHYNRFGWTKKRRSSGPVFRRKNKKNTVKRNSVGSA